MGWIYVKISEFLPDNEIVVIIDGYDMYYLLMILDQKINILFGKFNRFLYEKTFPTKCEHNGKKIYGLYIGYVKYLKLFISHIRNKNDCTDSKLYDQRILVYICDNDYFKNNKV